MTINDPPAIEPISVKIPQAVRLTGLSRSRIYELMKSGDIEFVKVGASTLILFESLRTFVGGRRPSAPGAPSPDGLSRDRRNSSA